MGVNCILNTLLGFRCGLAGKESTCSAGDLGLIPGLGRFPGEGKGHPLQYSGLENSMDCIIHGVAKSQTRLSDFHRCFFTKYNNEIINSVTEWRGYVYRWSCSWHQLSCCISLCTLLTGPVISKAWAKRLEEDSRDDRNCRCVYSLLDGAASIAADTTQHNTSTHNSRAFPDETYTGVPHKVICNQVSTSWCVCVCSVISELSSYTIMQSHYLQNIGQRARGYESLGWESLIGIILVIFPHSTPSRSLASQSACSPSSMIYPQWVTLTLEVISCNSSRCYDNSYILIT